VTTALLALMCLFGIVLVIGFGALVEMYEQLRQVRDHLSMIDQPTTLDLGESQDLPAVAVGLPAELATVDRATVLFLSNRCETCFQLAAALQDQPKPTDLWVVVVPVTGDVDQFIDRFDLRGERVMLDAGERIVGRLGLDVTPSAIVIEQGRLIRAQTVPTVRQMHVLLDAKPTPARVLVPKAPEALIEHIVLPVSRSDPRGEHHV
jgi:hypothetical protein